MNPFFDELFRHWNVRLRPGVSVIQIDVEDSDDEPSDFTDFMVVKDDPYEPLDAENGKPAQTKMEPNTETTMETPLATMATPVESKVEDSEGVPVVTIDAVSPAKEDPVNTPKETMEKTDEKVQQLAPSLAAEDVDERIKCLKFFAQLKHLIRP